MDWSSAYRLFSQKKFDTSKLFNVAVRATVNELDDDSKIVVSIDDTLLKKTGRKIPGASWSRDPLGPKFQTNFIWSQRFLQMSMALPDHNGISRSRAIPIDFHHCPLAKKPGKNADERARKEYFDQKKKKRLSVQGQQRLNKFRESLDGQGFKHKEIIACVDNSFTNSEVLKNLPDRSILIGRARKDTKLYEIPDMQAHRGRKRVYGKLLPTPEQIRQSDQYCWTQVKAWAAGKEHIFDVKIVKNARWRSAGEKHVLQVIIIRPLGYRLTKQSKMLYREPAYLICTDNNLKIDELLQAYLWRWEIEVNFREEKTLLGCGEAQIRNPNSVESVPAFTVAMYSYIQLASYISNKTNPDLLPRSLWYSKKENERITTGDMISNLRTQIWSKSIGNNFSGFVDQQNKLRSRRNHADPFTSAVFFCRN